MDTPLETEREKLLAKSLANVLAWIGLIRLDPEVNASQLLVAADTLTTTIPPSQQRDQEAWDAITEIQQFSKKPEIDSDPGWTWKDATGLNTQIALYPLSAYLEPKATQLYSTLVDSQTALATQAADPSAPFERHLAPLTKQIADALEAAQQMVPQQEPWTALQAIYLAGAQAEVKLAPAGNLAASWKSVALYQCGIADSSLERRQMATGQPEASNSDTLRWQFLRSGYTVTTPNINVGVYTGPLVQRTSDMVIQELGPREVAFHRNEDLANLPSIPQLVSQQKHYTIAYSGGKATATEVGRPLEPKPIAQVPSGPDPNNGEHEQINSALQKRLSLRAAFGKSSPNFQVFSPPTAPDAKHTYVGSLILETPNYVVQQLARQGDFERFVIHDKKQLPQQPPVEINQVYPVSYTLEYDQGRLPAIARIDPQLNRDNIEAAYRDAGYKTSTPDPSSGIYLGPIVQKAQEAIVQQIAPMHVVLHSPSDFAAGINSILVDGNKQTITYSKNVANVKPSRATPIETRDRERA